MPQLERHGSTLHFHDVGQGLPLLLIHGFPLASQGFWPQLETPPSGVRLIVPDLRGFGRSGLGSGPSTMEGFAEDCLAILDALRLETAVVGGVSMGGYVCMALTRRDPGRVRGLVLIDTQSTADDEAGRARREETAEKVEAQGAGVVADSMGPLLLSKDAPAEVRSKVDALIRAQDPKAIAAASRGMAQRVDAKDILSRFAGPCLVVVGSADVVTPLEKAKAMVALVPGAALCVLEGAGHLSNLEKPVEFNERVAQLAFRLT